MAPRIPVIFSNQERRRQFLLAHPAVAYYSREARERAWQEFLATYNDGWTRLPYTPKETK